MFMFDFDYKSGFKNKENDIFKKLTNKRSLYVQNNNNIYYSDFKQYVKIKTLKKK